MTPDDITLVLAIGTAGIFIAGRRRHWDVAKAIRRYMQTATALDFPRPASESGTDDPDWPDTFGTMPKLPRPTQRWTVRRKAAVIEAVRGGWVPIDEACSLYNISVDEFLAWERDIDRNGVPGLRTTRYQIYRDTDARRG
jgi:hypothetical protein